MIVAYRTSVVATIPAGFAQGWGLGPALHFPLPTPGFRPRIGVRGMLSPESLAPAHQVMKSRSCGLVQRIGAADSATPHPDPSGGQAPRLAKSSTALHFLIPPSAIGLQFGTFRRWRAGIEVD